jgi:formylglycine-generating enzyme required for sulfatase activity
MLETEVTESQYEISTGETGACTLDYGSGPDHPVRCVTWTDAQAFCEAAGGRLPTEAEFEYAARAGTTSKYYCGDEPECLEDIAWYGDNSDEMQPVAGLLPNEFGLYDMLGNAEEWTGDWYDDDYYSSGVVKDPTGPSTGSNRTVRGGAQGYYAEAEFCSSTRTVRVSERSNVHHPAAIDEYVGFRCVRVSP